MLFDQVIRFTVVSRVIIGLGKRVFWSVRCFMKRYKYIFIYVKANLQKTEIKIGEDKMKKCKCKTFRKRKERNNCMSEISKKKVVA